MLISSFWAVEESRSTTPLSRSRFPNMNMPMSGMEPGANRTASIRTVKGKRSFTNLGAGRGS